MSGVVKVPGIDLSSICQVSQTPCLSLLVFHLSNHHTSLLIAYSLCLSLPSARPSQPSCQPGVFLSVSVHVCVYVVCVNETDKSTLATPPTPNQTWQTNEICMLSNFHILPAVAFCKTPQGKYTPRLTNSVLHTLHVAQVITRDLLSAQGHKRNLHVKELIYFDKHICKFSSSQTRFVLHVPPVGCWASLYRLMCLGVWHYGAVFTFIAGSLNFLRRLLIKNGISRGRHTSMICDIINSLESRARFNIQETGNLNPPVYTIRYLFSTNWRGASARLLMVAIQRWFNLWTSQEPFCFSTARTGWRATSIRHCTYLHTSLLSSTMTVADCIHLQLLALTLQWRPNTTPDMRNI